MKVLIIGGTRYFGKRLVHQLLLAGHQIWVLSRGQTPDDFGNQVQRLVADRNEVEALKTAVESLHFDAVVDQVCMTAAHAQAAVDLFAGKTSYYLMTSTVSVYDVSADLTEEDYIAKNYQPRAPQNPMEAYGEGKRAAEHVFSCQNFFKVGVARFPIVLGEDDYTQRLHDQISNIRHGRAMYYPNRQAHISFITSEDAARALAWLVENQKEGAYNFAAKDVVTLAALVEMIEKATGV